VWDRDTIVRALFVSLAAVAVAAGVVLSRERGGAGVVALPPREVDAGGAGGVPVPCAARLEPTPGGGCLARASASAPRPLLVYLHGLHTDANVGEELDRQARVARLANERGVDMLALRGRLGACERLPETYCWPSNERTADRGPAVVAGWEPALAAATRRGASGARYLLGFSNGGYFAALVATRALVPFDAVAIAHGGPVEPVRARGAKPPVLLLTADDDASLPEMKRLDVALGRERWPHAIASRDGGHELTDGDIESALGFVLRASREGVPAAAARLVGHTPRARAGEREREEQPQEGRGGEAASVVDAGE
jgi:predicted esterase